MNKQEILARLQNPPIIAIIRADSSEELLGAAEALVSGGITAMEVTMTTPDALSVIKSVSEALGSKILMGVGTVLDTETCRMAILSGANFVVTPVMKPEVIQMCNRYSIPIACGAYTPTEALAAHEAGADFVKIFPADTLGPGFMKAILAPLPMLRLIPTGGVDASTAKSFLDAGCVAVAAGSSLVSKEILKTRDWATLTARARALVEAVG
jgi:2-dehydro-3-deoxyphosphogluconate aldolase / (4S)-4-hydroxy-2-oxoglutarate aldolase